MISKQQFNKAINDALTVNCKLPFKVDDKEIDRIVQYSSEWFYRNYEDALSNVYITIPYSSYASSNSFIATRSIQLPHCVYSISGLTKSNEFTATTKLSNNPDLTLNKFIYSDYSLGLSSSNSQNTMYSDSVLAYVVHSNWDDLLNHIMKFPLSYDYNRLTRKLFIKGDIKNKPDLILDVMVRVPYEALYELDLFYNHVLASCYIQLATLLGGITGDLPGGGTINYDVWKDRGDTLLEKTEQEVKDMNSLSFFYTTNGN